MRSAGRRGGLLLAMLLVAASAHAQQAPGDTLAADTARVDTSAVVPDAAPEPAVVVPVDTSGGAAEQERTPEPPAEEQVIERRDPAPSPGEREETTGERTTASRGEEEAGGNPAETPDTLNASTASPDTVMAANDEEENPMLDANLMQTDWLARGLAIAALAMALMLLGWHVYRYLRDKGRVRLESIPLMQPTKEGRGVAVHMIYHLVNMGREPVVVYCLHGQYSDDRTFKLFPEDEYVELGQGEHYEMKQINEDLAKHNVAGLWIEDTLGREHHMPKKKLEVLNRFIENVRDNV